MQGLSEISNILNNSPGFFNILSLHAERLVITSFKFLKLTPKLDGYESFN